MAPSSVVEAAQRLEEIEDHLAALGQDEVRLREQRFHANNRRKKILHDLQRLVTTAILADDLDSLVPH